MEEIRKSKSEIDGHCKQLEVEVGDLNREVTRLKTKLEVSSKNDQLLKQQREAAAAMKTERDQLKQELEVAKQQLQELRSEMKSKDTNSLKARELSKTLKEKEARVLELEKEVTSLNLSKKKLKDEADRMQKLLEEYKTKTKVLDMKLDEERKRLETELSTTKVVLLHTRKVLLLRTENWRTSRRPTGLKSAL